MKYLCSKFFIIAAQQFEWPKTDENKLPKLNHKLFLLINKLIQSETTEDKAIGLNIMASACGLTRDISLKFADVLEENLQ